jgi:hypothetical protein
MESITVLGESLADGRLFSYLGWQRRLPIAARMGATRVWRGIRPEVEKTASSYSLTAPSRYIL